MIFDVKNTKGKKAKLFDAQNKHIPMATKYNTRTREVTMFLMGTRPDGTPSVLTKKKKAPKGHIAWELLEVKVKIPGSYIVVNGKKF